MFQLLMLCCVFTTFTFCVAGFHSSVSVRKSGEPRTCPTTSNLESMQCFEEQGCYCAVNIQLNRTDARQFCQKNGMELLSIESKTEDEYIINLTKIYGLPHIWLSASKSKLTSSEDWLWNGDPTRPLQYTDWCRNQPDNQNQFDGENFMAMIGGCWHDVTGDYNWRFICELEDSTFDLALRRRPQFTFDIGSKSTVIPCRLTTPGSSEMKVDIWKEDYHSGVYHKIVHKGEAQQTEKYNYIPNQGFEILNVSTSDAGTYKCSVLKNEEQVVVNFYITVVGIGITRLDRDPAVEGETIVLTCTSFGIDYLSSTIMEWSVTYESGPNANQSRRIDHQAGTRVSAANDYARKMHSLILSISNATTNSSGSYKCFLQTNNRNFSESIGVRVITAPAKQVGTNKASFDSTIVVVASITSVVMGAALFVATFFLFRFYKAGKKEFDGLKVLLRGNSSQFNPDLPLDEQTELLPYDLRWEFPRNRLQLGRQLGIGAFGRVVEATAIGIRTISTQTQSSTMSTSSKTVAVKTTRMPTTVDALETLIGELKIMIHLGFHVNVVNLLGACTTRINRGELYVIVEYCRYGNLRNYLINHRDTFVNQVDSSGDLIRTNIDEQQQLVTESTGADECVGAITTRKLICWSFQIARGMEYLGSKKVVHGDLAARNILLSDNEFAKVADFGMSHKIYQDENYRKNSKGLIPLKWMAIESLIDRIFSSRSDAWSYGVVLWEMFSLGQMPYPGHGGDYTQFVGALKSGYRMEKPDYTPNCVAELMESCWKADPNERPTFSFIEKTLSNQLESTVTSYYLELSGDYVKQNNLETGQFLELRECNDQVRAQV